MKLRNYIRPNTGAKINVVSFEEKITQNRNWETVLGSIAGEDVFCRS
jgi:hypothetical protein